MWETFISNVASNQALVLLMLVGCGKFLMFQQSSDVSFILFANKNIFRQDNWKVQISDVTFIFLIDVDSYNQAERDFNIIFNKISTWMYGRKLKLSSNKTECILIGSAKQMNTLHNFRSIKLTDQSTIFLSE